MFDVHTRLVEVQKLDNLLARSMDMCKLCTVSGGAGTQLVGSIPLKANSTAVCTLANQLCLCILVLQRFFKVNTAACFDSKVIV